MVTYWVGFAHGAALIALSLLIIGLVVHRKVIKRWKNRFMILPQGTQVSEDEEITARIYIQRDTLPPKEERYRTITRKIRVPVKKVTPKSIPIDSARLIDPFEDDES